MSSQTYTILWRGQTSGPYPVEQIEQMLANRQISLSHQINNEGKMVFIEDFLAEKQAEAAQLKAEQEAKVAEAKAQAEHQRQKELMELDIARTQAAAPPPPMVEDSQVQGGPPVIVQGGPPVMPVPVPMAPAQSSSSGVLEGIFILIIIGALVVGGWFAYQHFQGADKVVGFWEGTGDSAGETITFSKDGSMYMNSGDENFNGKWKLNGESLDVTIQVKGIGVTFTFRFINERTIEATVGGETGRFIKK